MPLDTSVKYIHSAMTGAPALTNAAGSLLNVLNLVLVTGFGSQSVDSIVVSAGIATVTRAAGHSFEAHQVTKIAGATPSGLNGEKKIISATSTSYTFDAEGIADQTATGSITHSVAPLGWTKPYADSGNVGVFRAAPLFASGCTLRVDDTSASVARVRGYETMTGLSTGTNRFPEDNISSGGGYWTKTEGSGGNKAWIIIGDDRFFYYWVEYRSSYTNLYSGQGAFGDFLSVKQNPAAFECMLFAPTFSNSSSTPGGDISELPYNSGTDFRTISCPRDWRGINNPGYMRRGWSMYPVATIGNAHFSGDGGGTYPNPADNGLYTSPMVMSESGNVFRGSPPGMLLTSQTLPSNTFTSKQSVLNAVGLSGNRILKAICSTAVITTFFDITGPWR